MSRYHPLYWSLIAAISTTAYAADTAAHTNDLLGTVILPEAKSKAQHVVMTLKTSVRSHGLS